MIKIVLKEGQNGYNEVEYYINDYWRKYYPDTVIVSLGISYDGISYDDVNIVAEPMNFIFAEVVFNTDWWEGQKYIIIYGMKLINNFNKKDFEEVYKEEEGNK